MTTTKTDVLLEKWDVVKVPLERAGVNVAKLNKLQKASLIAQLETDEMIGEDQEHWNEYVDGLIEEHPTWATPLFHRRRCADDLLREFPGNEWDGNAAPAYEELMEAKYAVVWVGDSGNRYTLSAHKDEQDVVEAIARENTDEEPDMVEAVYDMDTDTKIADFRDIKITITVEWRGFTGKAGDVE